MTQQEKLSLRRLASHVEKAERTILNMDTIARILRDMAAGAVITEERMCHRTSSKSEKIEHFVALTIVGDPCEATEYIDVHM